MRNFFINAFVYIMLITSVYKFWVVMLSSPITSVKFFLNIIFNIAWFIASVGVLRRQTWARMFTILLCSIFPVLFAFFAIVFLVIDRMTLADILQNKQYVLGLIISFVGLVLFVPKETLTVYFQKKQYSRK